MRVAFVALGFPPDVGGSESYNIEYAKRLHARGHDVRVFTWETSTPGAPAVDAELPFEVRRLPLRRQRKKIAPDGLAETLAAWGSDVVLAARGSRALTLVADTAARCLPLVLAIHELRERHRDRAAIHRWRVRRRYGLDRAARIVACSEDTRRRICALGVPEQKVSLVYPGVDVERFGRDPESGLAVRRELGVGDRPMLLTVARLVANKGHERILRLLPAIREQIPNVVYVILGEGSQRETLERQADALAVRESVRFTGRVPDVRAFYHACDVFAMPSTPPHAGANAGEGFGIAYVEAGACGKPVVASSSGGGPEIVVDGETGLLVQPGDAKGLEAALLELLTSPEKARAMGARGRERAVEFDWARGVVNLERVLETAVATRGASPADATRRVNAGPA